MSGYEPLPEDQGARLAEVRMRIHESVSSIIALGDGGWRHGPKLMQAHADAINKLLGADALLADDTPGDTQRCALGSNTS